MWATDEKLIINKLMKACTYDKSYIPLFSFVEAPEVVKETSYIGVKQIPMHTAGFEMFMRKHACLLNMYVSCIFWHVSCLPVLGHVRHAKVERLKCWSHEGDS